MKHQKLFITGLACLLIGGSYLLYEGSESYQLVQSYRSRFYPQTLVNGLNLEGLTLTQATTRLTNQLEQQQQLSLTLTSEQGTSVKTLKDLGLQYTPSLESQLADILDAQQSPSFWEKRQAILTPTEVAQRVSLTWDEAIVSDWVQQLAQDWNVSPLEAAVFFDEDQTLVHEAGVIGYDLDTEGLMTQLNAYNSFPWGEDQQLEVSLTRSDSSESLPDLAPVQDIIGTYDSWFDSRLDRATNVKRAAELIHNTLILPGETFSFTDLTLPVIAENGYGYGTIFLYGKAVPGMGGGMCQTSSTLYNAMLEAGIIASERTNHSLPVGYVPAGQDATMTDTGLDLKFVNPFDVPILIQAHIIEGNTLRVSLWSDLAVLDGVDYEAYTEKVGARSYDTYLRSYRGNTLLEETYLHRSTYKEPVN